MAYLINAGNNSHLHLGSMRLDVSAVTICMPVRLGTPIVAQPMKLNALADSLELRAFRVSGQSAIGL